MTQSDRKGTATVSAVMLWLVLHALVALPVILDPPAMMKVFPAYVAGVVVFLEPLICFWAYYQYRYMLRAKPKSRQRDDLDV